MLKEIILVKPRGFCAGVERAIQTVEQVLKKYDPPIYVRHAIVHNEHVIAFLEKKGAIFVEDIEDIPDNATLILSAHGSPPEIYKKAKKRFRLIDATCPLVMKVHFEAQRYYDQGYKIVLIGKKGHQEVIGTMGYAPMKLIQSVEDVKCLPFETNEKIVCLTQTTLSMDDTKEIVQELRNFFPQILFPSKQDICYATQNRQNAVRELVKHVDHIFVIGSQMSSNSRQLVRTAQLLNMPVNLISHYSHRQIRPLINNVETLGITAGASVPEVLIDELVALIKKQYANITLNELVVTQETMKFPLPNIG